MIGKRYAKEFKIFDEVNYADYIYNLKGYGVSDELKIQLISIALAGHCERWEGEKHYSFKLPSDEAMILCRKEAERLFELSKYIRQPIPLEMVDLSSDGKTVLRRWKRMGLKNC